MHLFCFLLIHLTQFEAGGISQVTKWPGGVLTIRKTAMGFALNLKMKPADYPWKRVHEEWQSEENSNAVMRRVSACTRQAE
ncbi:hypothetical protein PMAYCL1PPCAC_09902, partial [Pristionchus mayeri]